MFCDTRNTKNTSAFDSISNFLRIVLSSHRFGTKGVLPRPKKVSCPGYGASRLFKWKKIVELFLPYIASFCGFIVILLKNDISTTQNVHIFQYKTAVKISVSKIKG